MNGEAIDGLSHGVECGITSRDDETTIKMAGFLAGVQTQYVPETSQTHSSCINVLPRKIVTNLLLHKRN